MTKYFWQLNEEEDYLAYSFGDLSFESMVISPCHFGFVVYVMTRVCGRGGLMRAKEQKEECMSGSKCTYDYPTVT